MLWLYSTADRLASARDHARAILAALQRRRCDSRRDGDPAAVLALDLRLAVHEARWRCLSDLARAERRRATAPSS